MRRVALVIHALVGGGAERVMAMIANHWAGEGREVTLLTLDDGSTPPFHSVDCRVACRPLGIAGVSGHPGQSIINNLLRICRLRAALKEADPEVVISFMSSVNVITLLAMAGTGIPVVVSERVDPRFHPVGRAWEVLRRLTYRSASRIVVQSHAVREFFPVPLRRRAVVIPNPVAKCAVQQESLPHRPGRTLVAMGRLEAQKGFDLLLRAFRALAVRHPQWRLEIYGEGSLRKELEAGIRGSGLQEQVFLCGMTRQPMAIFRRADLFVLPSRYEGFPNVLCEAMACGVAVVSFDCPSGPRDILRHGVDGLLVPPEDVEALGNAIDRLMRNDAERRRLAARGREVTERFSPEKIMGQWLTLTDEVIAEYRSAAGRRPGRRSATMFH
ncbi:MAG TPA: glycosyltransferase family 4 protein [Chthoniobacteraceae bacterium]|nr:glycosyltransferase family 4 protein [Chthoniobacteraceae bacterium]